MHLTLMVLVLSWMPPAEPSSRDIQMLAACITASADPSVCIGSVSDTCMEFEQDGSTSAGMIMCMRREHTLWDMRLNTAYAALRTVLLNTDRESRRDGVRTAQRAWISYRDAECAQRALQFEGGTMAGVTQMACMNDVTARRALELEAQLLDAHL